MHVSILGCGYVGLELGRRLDAAGHEVAGVRRSDDGLAAIREAGLQAVRADVTDPADVADLPDADALVYAASAGRGGDARETYVEGLRTVVSEFAGRTHVPDRLVYTSSTGVYGDHGGAWVDEETPPAPDSDRARTLVAAEEAAMEAADRGIDPTVVRLAGLYGPERYRLSRYLDGPVTEGYLNLVHRDDAAGAVAFLLTEDRARDEVVLAVDDDPVWRPDLAAWLAEELGREPPATQTVAERIDDASPGEGARKRIAADKRCSNRKLRGLGYDLAYPTFREGYREAVERRARDSSETG